MTELVETAKAHLRGNQLAEAAAAARQALASDPAIAEALMVLGTVGVLSGSARDAVALLRLSNALAPGKAATWNALGLAHRASGNLAEARQAGEMAVRQEPQRPEFLRNLAETLMEAKDLGGALALYDRLFLAGTQTLRDWVWRGRAFYETRQFEQGELHYRRMLELFPEDADGWFGMAYCLGELKRTGECIEAYHRCISFNPKKRQAYVNLAALYFVGGNPEKGAMVARAGLHECGEDPSLWANLALSLGAFGKSAEAAEAIERSLALRPGAEKTHSNGLFYRSYLDTQTPLDIYDAHRLWNERHARPLAREIKPHRNAPDPRRKLRVGYVSADFHAHSCAFFLQAPYELRDRDRFEIFSYSNTDVRDVFTQWFEDQSDHWRDIEGLSDGEAAELIRKDGIDILIDLCGHTARHRLLVFAHKPAPVQVTWLGYPTTTGLDTMDWKLSDAGLTPPGTEEQFSEKVYNLPRSCHCYIPQFLELPELGPPPAERNGYVTFGSFNGFNKISDRVLALWAQAMAAVPGSRLLLKSRNKDNAEAREHQLNRFAAAGGDPTRVDFASGHRNASDHLAMYNQIDVALDTTPYGGMTTTCEALLMGVPVVSLVGDRTSARYAVPIMEALDLTELLAKDADAYAAIAAGLAADAERRRTLRGTLRQRFQASPLSDGKDFVRALEDAYRDMWTRWCRKAMPPRD